MADMQPSATGCSYPQLYEAPPSLWEYIKSCASHHELPEIKSLLGESLVEQSLELHQEAELLRDIWLDYRQEMQLQPPKPRLPEPPAQRELLKAEIKFFIDSIHEKAKAHGRDPSVVLSRHNSQIMDYVLDDKGRASCSSRSSTDSPLSRFGRETPCRTPSRMSSAGRCDSLTLEEVRSTLNGKTVFQFDDVVHHLRDVLQREIGDLIEDIEFLQNCLDDEVNSRSDSGIDAEPTLSELREERSNLEKELLSSDFAVPSALRVVAGGSSSSTEETVSDDDVLLPVSEIDRKSSPSLRQRKLEANVPLPDKGVSGAHIGRVAVKAFPDEILAASVQQMQLSRGGSRTDASLPATTSAVSSQSLKRLLRAASPSHVTVRTGNAPTRSGAAAAAAAAAAGAQVVHVATIPADAVFGRVPVPPSSARPPPRPSSAQRFRNMVLECRDGK